MNWIEAHPAFATLAGYYICSAFVGALPAPTANSTMLYQFVFKFVNILAANVARAHSTTIEKSPNFLDALARNGLSGLPPPPRNS